MKKHIHVKKIYIDENKIYFGCAPLSVFKTMPNDQTPCTIEKCRNCNKKMWVSELKKFWRSNKDNVEIYCMPCLFFSGKAQGIDMMANYADIKDMKM
jgi:hypothetical protein